MRAVIADHDVRVLFTASTAMRAIKRENPRGRFAKERPSAITRIAQEPSCSRSILAAFSLCGVNDTMASLDG